jgi:putative ABC transport system ATP-binding protein
VPIACSFCVTGPSGSGKSSLLSLLAGLDLPSAGRLEILGKDIATLSEEERTRFRGQHLGFVFQNHQLLHQLTALENIMLPLEIQGRPHARAQAVELLGEVGLSERAHHYPSTLSGGEQQRVGLARAFAIRPQLLLADEPTGSLDAQTGERIANLMFDLNKSHGTTLVLVTHDEALAARCDQGIRLSAGRGTPR